VITGRFCTISNVACVIFAALFFKRTCSTYADYFIACISVIFFLFYGNFFLLYFEVNDIFRSTFLDKESDSGRSVLQFSGDIHRDASYRIYISYWPWYCITLLIIGSLNVAYAIFCSTLLLCHWQATCTSDIDIDSQAIVLQLHPLDGPTLFICHYLEQLCWVIFLWLIGSRFQFL